jgi:hypothetical protein
MRRFPIRPRSTLAAFLGLAAASTALAQDGSDDLRREVDELRRMNEALLGKVDRLEKMVGDDEWLTETRAAEIRAIVQDTLADSAARTSLQSSGQTAGWDKGFFLASADGNFRMNIKGQIQFRWAFDYRDRPAGAPVAATDLEQQETWGFEIRRARFSFSGYLIDPSWEYELQPALRRNGGGAGGGSLDNAWVRKSVEAFGGKASLRAGQFKGPYNKEETVSSARQLVIERTLVGETFTTKWVQGIEFVQAWDRAKIYGFYGDRARGLATIPTDGTDPALGFPDSINTGAFSVPQTDYSFIARAEWLASGAWKQVDDQTSPAADDFGLLFGVAGMAEAYRGLPASETIGGNEYFNPASLWGVTADVTVAAGGFTMLAAGYFRQVELASEVATRGGGTNDDMLQWGFTIQGGFYLTDHIEPYARWEVGSTDTDQYRTDAAALGADAETANVITLGANWFPEGSKNRNIKLSGDIGFSLAPVVDFAQTGANWLPALEPAAGRDYDAAQIVIRPHLQLLF